MTCEIVGFLSEIEKRGAEGGKANCSAGNAPNRSVESARDTFAVGLESEKRRTRSAKSKKRRAIKRKEYKDRSRWLWEMEWGLRKRVGTRTKKRGHSYPKNSLPKKKKSGPRQSRKERGGKRWSIEAS